MALPHTLSRPAVDSRHGNAMLMMVVSSVLISFGGLIIRSLDDSSDNIRPEVREGIALGEVIVADQTITGTGVILA